MEDKAASRSTGSGGELFEVRAQREVPAGAVRTELDRILASQAFSGAGRPGRFLKFLVERALEGKGGELTEYILATEICNRKPSFDPASDPIVRAEAARLRRKLQEYYHTEGGQDPVVIELPPRTYFPVFHKREGPAPQVGWIRSWMPVSATWKLTVLVVALGIVAGLAAYWAAGGFGRKSSPEPPQAGARGVASAPPHVAHSIIVLPFADFSPNRDQEYFCDGLTEELTEALTKVGGLHVVARTTAFQFKGRANDVREIGRRLNVGLVLEGSVRKSGDRLRITAQLINAADGYEMWAGSYDREIKDIIKIQEEIAGGIAATLYSELTARRQRPFQRSPTSVDAYDHYLKGLHSARQWTTEGLTEAVGEFERAVALDPSYAPAYAALAEYYALLGERTDLAPREVMPKARAAAMKALELDSSLPRAHASLALVKAIYDWDWKGAEQSFRRASELEPSDPNVHKMLVTGYLMPRGRLDEALKEIQDARARDPMSPRVESILGMVHYFRREPDLAIEQFRKTLQLDSRFEAARIALGSAYEQKSRFVDALAAVQEGNVAWRSGAGMSMLGHTYALMGRRAEAEKLIQELVELSKSRYVSPGYVAAIYAGLGDTDRVMDWLDRAYELRAASLVFLKVNQRYDSVRSDPRFTALIRKIHLD